MAMQAYQMPHPRTGETITVYLPPNPTEAQVNEALAPFLDRADLEHFQSAAAGPTGVGSVPSRMEPPPQGMAFDYGRFRENLSEVKAKYGGEFAEDDSGKVFWRPDGKTDWQPMNPPGFDWSDPARIAGETLGPTLGATAGALMGKSPLGVAAKAAIGGGLGSLLNEGYQNLEGTQRENVPTVLKRAGMDAAIEGVTAGVGVVGDKLLRAQPLAPGSKKATQTLQEAIDFQQNSPAGTYPAPLAIDIQAQTGARGGLIPGNVMAGAGRQADASTGVLSGLRADMAEEAWKAARDEFTLPPQQREAVDAAYRAASRDARRGMQEQIGAIGPGAEAGGYQAQQGLRAGLSTTKEMVSDQYQGPLARALETEKPVFDLSPAKKRWNAETLDRTTVNEIIAPDGLPALDVISEKVAVIPTAEGKIAYLKRVLSSLDDKQTNFEAIKQIRTKVGDYLQDPAFATSKDNPARRLYSELTEVLKNPTNKGKTPKYLDEFENANLLTEWRAGLRDSSEVRSALKKTNGSRIIMQAAQDPGAILTPEFRELVSMAPASTQNKFREAVQQAMLDNENPAAMLDSLKTASNPEPYNFLFRSQDERQAFEEAADTVSSFYQSPMGKLYKARNDSALQLKQVLGSLKDPREARVLWESLSPQDKELTRTLLIDDAVTNAIAYNKNGTSMISPGALDKQIQEMTRNGTWGLLNPEQRKRVTGMKSYYRTVFASGQDTGTSLETASMVAGLKPIMSVTTAGTLASPGVARDVIRSGTTLFQNYRLAQIMANPKRAQKLMQRAGKGAAPTDPRGMAAGALIVAPFLLGLGEEEFMLGENAVKDMMR